MWWVPNSDAAVSSSSQHGEVQLLGKLAEGFALVAILHIVCSYLSGAWGGLGFLLVDHREYPAGGNSEFLVSDVAVVELGGSMNDDGAEFSLLGRRRAVELFKQLGGGCAHAGEIKTLVSGGKCEVVQRPRALVNSAFFRRRR